MTIGDIRETDLPETEAEHSFAVSRRKLMKTAAGVGVAAASVGMVGSASVGMVGATSASPSPYSGGGVNAPDASKVDGPVIVHLSDLRSGAVEVFTASTHTRITDHDLAARIARAAAH